MRDHRTMELGIVAAVLLAGAWLFVRAVGMADAVPEAYRSASPGFGWAWDFVINLTDLSDEELVGLKRDALKRIRAHYRSRNPSVHRRRRVRRLLLLNRLHDRRESRRFAASKRRHHPEWC